MGTDKAPALNLKKFRRDVRDLGFEIEYDSELLEVLDPDHGRVGLFSTDSGMARVWDIHCELYEAFRRAFYNEEGVDFATYTPNWCLHDYDIPARRVSPAELEKGDIVALYSPPSRGSGRHRIRTVESAFETGRRGSHHRIVVSLVEECEAESWPIVEEDGELKVEDYVVRLDFDPRGCGDE
ncbi:MAG: hypothetical protein ABEN55_06700 [Bradymonadaceae bacterium]